MMRSTQSLVLLFACLLVSGAPGARGQAFASAGGGGTGAVAGAGNGVFGNLFPFFFPFSLPCSNAVSINPWLPATTIPAPPPGLLTFLNNIAVFSDVSLCPGGVVNFQWTGNHNIVQLATGTCPTPATPAQEQKQLVPATVGGASTLNFATPGTFWLTSTVGTDCSQGQLLKVVVPNNGGFNPTLPAAVPTPPTATPPMVMSPPLASGGPGPSALALGTPGGTSTSTGMNSAASASGPPGTSRTATGNGTAISSSGNPAALNSALGLLGRRLQQTSPGNTAASFNPSGPNNCTEQRLTPNGMGGGAFSQGACNKTATSLNPAGDVAAAGNGGTALTGPGASFSTTPAGRRMLRGHHDETHQKK